jgi:hypothetical protein
MMYQIVSRPRPATTKSIVGSMEAIDSTEAAGRAKASEKTRLHVQVILSLVVVPDVWTTVHHGFC